MTLPQESKLRHNILHFWILCVELDFYTKHILPILCHSFGLFGYHFRERLNLHSSIPPSLESTAFRMAIYTISLWRSECITCSESPVRQAIHMWLKRPASIFKSFVINTLNGMFVQSSYMPHEGSIRSASLVVCIRPVIVGSCSNFKTTSVDSVLALKVLPFCKSIRFLFVLQIHRALYGT